jgi:chloride channel protein, CIC family
VTPSSHTGNDGQRASSLTRLSAVTVLTGVGAGIAGMALARLLHAVQHVAYGYSPHELMGPESFFDGVSAASPVRRVAVLVVCGMVAGCGWYLLYRFARPLVSIEKAIASDRPRLPGLATTIHAMLQIVTVALGSPLGREVAPRELSATYAGWLAERARLTVEESRVMVACAAGAGLAAVYNAPLGGAMFALEVLLRTFGLRALLPAVATAGIAVGVAWSGLGNDPAYAVPKYTLDASLIVWSIVSGPLIGITAYGFRTLTNRARARAPHDWQLLVLSPINFAVVGVLAIPFPQLLGNGRAPAQLGFAGELSIGLAAVLLALRIAITASSLRAGASGGRLTPNLSNGALLAIVVGGLWSMVWPSAPLGAFAIIGATAFVAVAMNMPITAIILTMEFTWIDLNYLVPILFAVTGALAADRLCCPLGPTGTPPDRGYSDCFTHIRPAGTPEP